jgi:hypothetical protein
MGIELKGYQEIWSSGDRRDRVIGRATPLAANLRESRRELNQMTGNWPGKQNDLPECYSSDSLYWRPRGALAILEFRGFDGIANTV